MPSAGQSKGSGIFMSTVKVRPGAGGRAGVGGPLETG